MQFLRLFLRSLSSVMPQAETILPRWSTERNQPLREIVIVRGEGDVSRFVVLG